MARNDTLARWTAGVIGPRRDRAVVIDVPGYPPKLLEAGESFRFSGDGWHLLAVGAPDQHRGVLEAGLIARKTSQVS
jgi:hypothetical protein